VTASPTHNPAAEPAPQQDPTSPDRACSAEDRRLVEECLASAPGAWDQCVERFGGLLAHVVDRTGAQRHVSLSLADRDDLIAEVLVELLRNDAAALRSFAGRSSLPTYLTVIARRVVVRVLFRSAGAGRGGRPMAAEPVDRFVEKDDAEMRIAEREEVELMLGRLEEPEALLVRLHHLESRSYGEISRITGMPLGSIGPALSKARQKMRALAGDGVAAS
jgi:RNA polymerase sigma-70 factor (ECF subfamily)